MFALTLKGLWAHKIRYALTGLAVVLGVAFMAGTMILTDTMKSTFDGVIATGNEDVDVIVQRAGALDGDFETARARVDEAIVDDVTAVDGVAVARGSVQGFAQLVNADGTVAGDDGLGVTVGANWIDDEQLNPFSLAAGRAPETADEAVIDGQTATSQGWELGDEFSVLSAAGPHSFVLVGTATYGTIDGLPGTTLVATTDDASQRLFGEPGRFDSVLVAGDTGVSPDELAARIESGVAGPETALEVVTGEQDTAEKQADLAQDLQFFNTFLMAFAYIALFVGTFIIYNTFSIVVAQRTKELAMLRAIGARRAQVLRSVLIEAVVVGLGAAGVGLAAGIGLSFGLRELLAAVGLEIPSGSLVISSSTIVTAFAVGCVTCVVSAVLPAVRASRIRPIAALRELAIDRSGVSLVRAMVGLLVTGLGVAAFVAGVAADGSDGLSLLGLGALTVIFGVFTLGPVLVRPAVRFLGLPIAATGVTGAYARENAQRAPKRSAATASALMIGVALVGFITILASSTSASIQASVDRSFRADYVVDSGSWDHGFATTVEADVNAIGEIDEMSPLRTSVAAVDGATTDILAVDTTVFDDLYDLNVVAGHLTDVAGKSVAVANRRATEDGLAVGDTVEFTFEDGVSAPMSVRAIYDTDIAQTSGDWLFDIATFEEHVTNQFDRQLFVSFDDDVTASQSRASLDAALSQWPNASIEDQAEYKEAVTAEIEQILNLIYGLLALAVVIALIGIANTLALSVSERTRELGLLRAVGMHRRQLRRAVRGEALLISVFGAAMGVVLALGGAWGIVRALGSEGVTEMSVPTARLLVVVTIAAVAGVVAAVGPARRAARLDILEAIAHE